MVRLFRNGNEEEPQKRPVTPASGKGLSFLKSALHACYTWCYITGIQTIRLSRFAGKRLGRALAPAGRFFYKVADAVLLRHLRTLGAECKRFGRGFPLAARGRPGNATRFWLSRRRPSCRIWRSAGTARRRSAF